MWKSLLVLFVAVCVYGDDGEWKEIKTPQGPVRGRKDPSGVYIFSNIPYGTIGPNRFGPPLPPPAWLVLLDTPDKPIVCPQAPQFPGTVMKEECLIANVFKPNTDEKKLPVVVYVHGGAFELGYGNMMYPTHFVKEHNVIVVTFNYRLGPQGFLCLGTDSIPGNAGMKDQVQLLRWVQRNIASYGGNPEDVTIVGYSAGSVSVDLLMLSKSAKGLFNKVIHESGVGVSSIAIQADPLENAKKLARQLNFTDVDDVYALEQFYKNAPLESLFRMSFTHQTDASVPFGPCVERKSSSAFLTDAPIDIIKKKEYKKVPMLIGFSNFEGLLMVNMFNFEDMSNKMNTKFADFVPADLQFENESQKEEVANLIKKFYFGDKAVGKDTILAYVDFFSDVTFIYPTLRTVKLHAQSGHEQIFLYEYSFTDKDVPFVPHTEVRGADHCAQTTAIFDGAGFMRGPDESQITEEFKNMKKTMRELWNNFARNGTPVPEGSSLPSWPSAGVDHSPHMSLNQPLELRTSLVESRVRLWEDIYHKYYRVPTPPPKPPHTEL